VGQYAEAAVVGSALMQAIENSPDTPAKAVAELIITLRSQVGKRQRSSNKRQATGK
jgi:tryptophan synthase alpha subunit